MKKSFLFLYIAMVLFSCSRQSDPTETLKQFYDTKVPDRREVVFDVEAVESAGQWVLRGETDSENLKQEVLAALADYHPVDSIRLLPDLSVGEKLFGLVCLSVGNLRSKPAHSAELATQALMGTPVRILKKQNDWFLVQTPDQYISWIDTAAIFPVTTGELEAWKKSDRTIVLPDFEQVFEQPSFDAAVVSDLTMGNIVEITNETGAWLGVKLPDGRTGFVARKSCEPLAGYFSNHQPAAGNLLASARHLMGRPYLWGGTSAKAMDCSGFNKTVFFMNGLILARDASLQAKYGEPVSFGEKFTNVNPGDLLFFGRDSVHISHVAISLGGSDYIHSSGSAGKVQINSLDPTSPVYSGYHRDLLKTCRRPVGTQPFERIVSVLKHPWYF
jgi:cell wall-associated NlpC family hydrolase